MILYINACVRKDSRTKRLAEALLQKLQGDIEEIKPEEYPFPVVNESFLQLRDSLLEKKELEHPIFALARQFARADEIVIAAPYWDLSFPASLKQYFEQINVTGITFEYTPQGYPVSLCKAKQLYYIMTAGGMFVPQEYGFGYVKSLAENFYGIKDIKLFKAIGLDIIGADEETIMQNCLKEIRESLGEK